MLEQLANIGELLGGVAVIVSLVYVGFQIRETRRQLKSDAVQQRIDSRINIWKSQLELESLQSAQDKFFEHELYKRDVLFPEIEELTIRERRALISALLIELVYYQNLHYQREHGILDEDHTNPLNYMRCLMHAPQRRFWKDVLRLGDHFPHDFIRHVDGVVKRYDKVEKIMDSDEDADFEATVANVFDLPPPPPWTNHA